jgi:hypothetical protein
VGAQGRTRSVNISIQDSWKMQQAPSDAGEKSKPMNNIGQPKLFILQYLPIHLTPELDLGKQSTQAFGGACLGFLSRTGVPSVLILHRVLL